MEIFAAFSLGILGSFHCLGMCGPIALAIPHSSNDKFTIFVDTLLYNFGRILTYSILGFMFGLLGSGLSLAGLQEKVSLFAGIILLAMLLFPKKYKSSLNNVSFFYKHVGKLKSKLSFIFSKRSKSSIFVLGLLNGLLPCGLVYVALAASIAGANPWKSSLFMAFFGLGTFPMMSAIYSMKNMITISLRNRINKLIPYSIAVVAILLILRSMSLGIPYVSPQLEKQDLSQKEQVPACCAHPH